MPSAVETTEGWEIPAAGGVVSSVMIGAEIGLLLRKAGHYWKLTLVAPLAWRTHERETTLDAETGSVADLCRLLELRERLIVHWTISRDGVLALALEPGITLLCRPEPDYEAWEVINDDGELIVCDSGRGVVIFSETAQSFDKWPVDGISGSRVDPSA